jgi:hypothetical protein
MQADAFGAAYLKALGRNGSYEIPDGGYPEHLGYRLFNWRPAF